MAIPNTFSNGTTADGPEVNENFTFVNVPIGFLGNWLKTFASADSGTTDSTTANKLVQSGQNFETTVEIGYVVHNTTDDTFAYVTAVDSDTTLSLDSDIIISGEAYTIYKTPALEDNWVECNGQVLSDADSVYNGETIPNLNSGTYKMLRGAISSGATGGADTHTLITAEIPAHTHTIPRANGVGGNMTSTLTAGTGNYPTSSTGSGDAHNNLPAYYSVVHIMKVK